MTNEPPRQHVDWAVARDANRLNWDDRAGIHEAAYDVGRYAEDPAYVSTVVADDLPVLASHLGADRAAAATTDGARPLDGLDVLHLQCHIGTDTISLARCGARVTGLDFSPDSLAAARRLAAASGADVTWVEADVLDARAAMRGEFDVVYSSIGTLVWLDDLDRWAAQVAALLRPGGFVYYRDAHQGLLALDETADDLRLAFAYFPDGRAEVWDSETTYAGDGTVAHARTYQWPHPPSEIVTALLRAGLVLERFDEGRELPWRFSPRMVEVAPERWAWPEGERDRVPCSLTLVARRRRECAQ